MYCRSSCFLFVLENKKEKESIAEATKRMMKKGQILVVKQNGRLFYVKPDELKEDDVIHDMGIQKGQPETQNNLVDNAPDKPPSANVSDNQTIGPEDESLPRRRSKLREEVSKWREIFKDRKRRRRRCI